MNFGNRPQQPFRQRLGGRYQVVSQLGVGGFSQTYLAQDLHLPGHTLCVVKQFKPQVDDPSHLPAASRLFDTEAKVLYQLGEHPQIPRLLAHFEEDQEFYLVQEFIEGKPLAKLLSNRISGAAQRRSGQSSEAGSGPAGASTGGSTGGSSGDPALSQTSGPVAGSAASSAILQIWTEQRVVALLKDILQILTFVHAQSVIHRDIKPSNLICRNQDGRIVLIDFGAVKQVSSQLGETKFGQSLTISIGTQGYMPIEQLSGNPRFSSDIYAVGIVGIQALTGISPKRFTQNHLTGELDWRNLPCFQPDTRPHSGPNSRLDVGSVQISPEFAAILDRMVCYHFKDRYQTAAEALQALESLGQGWGQGLEQGLGYWPEEAEAVANGLGEHDSHGNGMSNPLLGPLLGPLFGSDQRTLSSPGVAPVMPLPDDQGHLPAAADLPTSGPVPTSTDVTSDFRAELGGADLGGAELEPVPPTILELTPAVFSTAPTSPPTSVEPTAQKSPEVRPDLQETDLSSPDLSSPSLNLTDVNSQPDQLSHPSRETSPPETLDGGDVSDPLDSLAEPAPPLAEDALENHSDISTEVLLPPHGATFASRIDPMLGAVPANLEPSLEPNLDPNLEPQVRPESGHRRLVLGLGVASVVAATIAIPLLSHLWSQPPSDSAEQVALNDLPCREPAPPALPSREPDYEYKDGTRFYGEIAQGKPVDGRAIMVFPSGNRYDGEFSQGQRNGCGTLTFASGKRYMGQFQDDKFNGQGVWTLETGDRYVGAFQNNRCHGSGIFVLANGTTQPGEWQNGKQVNGNLSCD